MTTNLRLGAPRAVFLSAASMLPMLRGPAVAYSPEDDLGGGGDGGGEPADAGSAPADNQGENQEQPTGAEAPAEGGEGEGEGEQPKPRNSAQERISQLTREKHEANRRAAEAERRAQEAERRLKGDGNEKPTPEAGSEEPDPSKYKFGDTDPAYIRDLARYEARQAYAAEAQASAARNQAQQVEQTWRSQEDAFAADKPDYFEKVYSDDLTLTPPMVDALVTSEQGAAVAYHLASNPDEARRIAALNPLAQIREIGRLEGMLAQQSAAPTAPQPKTISDAPTPPPQNRGQGGKFKPAPDTDDFAAFERAYGRS